MEYAWDREIQLCGNEVLKVIKGLTQKDIFLYRYRYKKLSKSSNEQQLATAGMLYELALNFLMTCIFKFV